MINRSRISLLGFLLAASAARAQAKPRGLWQTNGTYINNATVVAADPYVRWDASTGSYWAYSTEGADDGGGAIKNDSKNVWAEDWWWAPECYYNEKTGWYFLFHAGRYLNSTKIAEYFKYPDFEEASKIGVAVSRSPAGPFASVADRPIDYYPFDPTYHDVNLLMSPPYLTPPATLAEGETAPFGTYIPSIDPNVFFEDDGSIWLFFSRNAYRNWVWSAPLGKYIEESNIYAVRLDDAWWHDPHARTPPPVNASLPGPTRKDGWVPVIAYATQPQVWEDAHVDDHAASAGTLKDRRWAEGSTTVKRHTSEGDAVYFLTYSANNYQSPDYGVGYAFATSVTGPYYKSGSNPVLSQDASRQFCSSQPAYTGSLPMASCRRLGLLHGPRVHRRLEREPERAFYPHHARPSPADDRCLYTARLFIEPDALYLGFGPDAGDLRLPSGVVPLTLAAKPVANGSSAGVREFEVTLKSATGAAFDLGSPLGRVRAEVVQGGGNVTARMANGSTLVVSGGSGAQVRLVYERARSNVTAPWLAVSQSRIGGDVEVVETT
ncbi:glycoside hydrolase family 43 protein [Epithele typhae]|uniref:glycoside hydrolase family 43 protein n=1 Tax=Epithele typhae TaxID=378194 RepID=UPI00200780B3|nr:glycoside hydrolase family 43 protein [Epithele typhae]KAH9912243.1 glycoside hydrolase family 43 protein [Epithele typhae]